MGCKADIRAERRLSLVWLAVSWRPCRGAARIQQDCAWRNWLTVRAAGAAALGQSTRSRAAPTLYFRGSNSTKLESTHIITDAIDWSNGVRAQCYVQAVA
jgi:hypothetical protein